MITTLTGANDFSRGRELNKLMSDFVTKYSEVGFEQIDGEEESFERLQGALQSLPFLASKKLVVLKSPSLNQQFVEKAADLLGDIAESIDVILVEPKLDKRLSYYKFLKKTTNFREFNELDTNNLAKWLVQSASEQGGRLSLSDAHFLVDRVGHNQQLLSSELEKLLLYDPTISRQTVEKLTERTPQSTIFELLDAAFAGNAQKTLNLYGEQRALKIEPQQIIAMLAWQLHIFVIIKAAGNRSVDEIAREAKINPFVVRKSLATTKQISSVALKKMIADLLTLDVRLKSENLNADDALSFFLLNR